MRSTSDATASRSSAARLGDTAVTAIAASPRQSWATLATRPLSTPPDSATATLPMSDRIASS